MNPFGNNAFSGGLPAGGYPGAFPQPGYGQFPNTMPRFYNGNAPFPPGNAFGNPGFPPGGMMGGPMGGQMGGPMGGPMGPNYPMPLFPGNGFGMQPSPFGPSGPMGPPLIIDDPNRFGSGSYGRPRSRHSSRHRSHSRHRSRSPSSSDDERHGRGSPFGGRGSPFAGPGIQYANLQPFSNMPPPVPPRGGSPMNFMPRAW